MTLRLKKIITIGIICLVLATGLGIYANKWAGEKMQRVVLGLAESSFPYREYTDEELAKMYPQIKYANVPTRITPEETYTKFRQALKENNLEMAIEQLGKESKRYRENIDVITRVHEEGKFNEAFESYPEKIEKESMAESIASYYFLEKKGEYNLRQYIGFIKDANGDWKLDSL